MDIQPTSSSTPEPHEGFDDLLSSGASIGTGSASMLNQEETIILSQMQSLDLDGNWSVEKIANIAQDLVTGFDPQDRPPYTQEMRDGFKEILREGRDSLVDKGIIELVPGQSFEGGQAPDWALYRLKR